MGHPLKALDFALFKVINYGPKVPYFGSFAQQEFHQSQRDNGLPAVRFYGRDVDGFIGLDLGHEWSG
jgi:hypothetical protein